MAALAAGLKADESRKTPVFFSLSWVGAVVPAHASKRNGEVGFTRRRSAISFGAEGEHEFCWKCRAPKQASTKTVVVVFGVGDGYGRRRLRCAAGFCVDGAF